MPGVRTQQRQDSTCPSRGQSHSAVIRTTGTRFADLKRTENLDPQRQHPRLPKVAIPP